MKWQLSDSLWAHVNVGHAWACPTTPYEKYWIRYFCFLVIYPHTKKSMRSIGDISDQRILQYDWLGGFAAVTPEKKSQIWGLYWKISLVHTKTRKELERAGTTWNELEPTGMEQGGTTWTRWIQQRTDTKNKNRKKLCMQHHCPIEYNIANSYCHKEHHLRCLQVKSPRSSGLEWNETKWNTNKDTHRVILCVKYH